jgi:hypothetical protein
VETREVLRVACDVSRVEAAAAWCDELDVAVR